MNIGSSMGMMPNASAMSEMRTKMFAKADADGNGGLNIDEFNKMAESSPMGKASGVNSADAFKKLDADGDGSLTSTELDTGMKEKMQAMMSRITAFAGAQDDTKGSKQSSAASESPNAWLLEQLTKLSNEQVATSQKAAKSNPLSIYA
jgi:hypothetical protein